MHNRMFCGSSCMRHLSLPVCVLEGDQGPQKFLRTQRRIGRDGLAREHRHGCHTFANFRIVMPSNMLESIVSCFLNSGMAWRRSYCSRQCSKPSMNGIYVSLYCFCHTGVVSFTNCKLRFTRGFGYSRASRNTCMRRKACTVAYRRGH